MEWPVWFVFIDQAGRLHLWDLMKKTPCRWCWQGVFDAGTLFQTPKVGKGGAKMTMGKYRWLQDSEKIFNLKCAFYPFKCPIDIWGGKSALNTDLQKVHKSKCAFSGLEGAIEYIGGDYRTGKIQLWNQSKSENLQKVHRNKCAFSGFELAVTYMRG